LQDRNDIRVHAYEPEPGAIEQCRRTIADEPRIELHPFGLAGRQRTERLTVVGPGSSIYADKRFGPTLESVEIELRDVVGELAAMGVDGIDLIKINIEGGEYELLDRLYESGWLPRIDTLIVQFHEFAPDAYRARRRNRRQLSESHLCSWNYTWVYERWDRR